MYTKIVGVYCIINKINNKVYVGSSTSINKRKSNHFYKLKVNKHPNAHLQSSFNLYGSNNFMFKVLELCNTNELISREQFWIDFYNASNKDSGYNINPVADLKTHTKETKDKISMSNKLRYINGRIPFLLGKTHTIKVKRLLSKLLKGRILSLVTRNKLSAIRSGKKLSEAHKLSIKLGCKNIIRTKEWGNNIGEAQKIPVLQFDLENRFIAKYSSFREAALAVGVAESGISLCSSGRIKTHRGYIWKKQ